MEDKTQKSLRQLDRLLRNTMEEWDWDLAGGAWPSEIERIVVDETSIDRFIETGVRHYMQKQPRYYWRRVYDDDGNIDYDLSEWYEEHS